MSDIKEIVWSEEPGCYESDLKRRYKNPLFENTLNDIPQQYLKNVRDLDKAEFEFFLSKVKQVYDLWEDFKERPSSNIVYEFLKDTWIKLTNLIIEAYHVGGSALKCIDELYRFKKEVMNILDKILNPDETVLIALKHLDKSFNENDHGCVFIYQLFRENSPIKKSGIVESILSEGPEDIRNFLALYKKKDENKIDIFKREAVKLIFRSAMLGNKIPMIKEKIEILGLDSSIYEVPLEENEKRIAGKKMHKGVFRIITILSCLWILVSLIIGINYYNDYTYINSGDYVRYFKFITAFISAFSPVWLNLSWLYIMRSKKYSDVVSLCFWILIFIVIGCGPYMPLLGNLPVWVFIAIKWVIKGFHIEKEKKCQRFEF